MDIENDWPAFYDWAHASFMDDVEFYLEELKDVKGPVLELGCGTGRVTIPLAKQGIAVTAIDISPDMVESAKKKAALDGVTSDQANFIVGDMRDFNLDRTFSAVLMPYRSFQWLLSIVDQRCALLNAWHHLLPEGKLIFDVFNPTTDVLRDDGEEPFLVKDVPGEKKGHKFQLLFQNQWDHNHQINNASLIAREVGPGGKEIKKVSQSIQVRYTYRYEMMHLLELSGFQPLELYGSFARDDYQDASEHMIWIAQRLT